jgi:hypothetical protein
MGPYYWHPRVILYELIVVLIKYYEIVVLGCEA